MELISQFLEGQGVVYGMATKIEGGSTRKIGEFCCTNNYVKFLIFHLRTHTERVEGRVKELSSDDETHTHSCTGIWA